MSEESLNIITKTLETPTCRICASLTTKFGSHNVLNEFDAHYYRCPSCGFIQTEEPFWLEKAYRSAISASDLGYVQRNLDCARITKGVINLFFNPAARFVDFGGGYGLLVRMMRDAGFDFYRYEQFCENLFARGFDAELPDKLGEATRDVELLTAFEVMEHLPDPMEGFETMLKFSKNILASTTLLPSPPPPLGSWWYYGTQDGQHVSFYTREALMCLAEKFGLSLVTDGKSLHLLSSRKISSRLFDLVANHKRVTRVLNALRRRKSLQPDDFLRITGVKLPQSM